MSLFKPTYKGVYIKIPKPLKKKLDIFIKEQETTIVGFLTKVIEEREQLWDYINEQSQKIH